MEFYYYSSYGSCKVKRRYLYAFWAGMLGFCAGALLTLFVA